MPPLVIPNLGLGLNLHDPATEVANGQVVLCKNMLLTRGVCKTPFGFGRIGAVSLPLAHPVIGLRHYQEQGHSPTDHVVAMTTSKLYTLNAATDAWTDISPATALRGGPDSIPSFAAVPHTDAIAADGDGIDCYYHLLACDGGNSPVYRWAGKFETKFYALAGADGYHETDESPTTPTAHYCRQVNAYYNHVILLSPKTWDAAADEYIENPQALYWGKAGLLETDPVNPEGKGAFDLNGTGAGYAALVDTGDSNVWCELLGDYLIIYQRHSLWSLYHVGGTDVFRAQLAIPNLGLLSPGLITAWRDRHFFVGNDFKPYVYFGGSSLQSVGESIAEALKDDIDPTRLNRCRMTVGSNGRRIWLFIVRNGEEYITRGYGLDTLTGAWMVRDFDHLYDTDEGLTAAALIGSQEHIVGRSWQQDIDTGQTYTEAITAGTTWAQLMSRTMVGEAMMVADTNNRVYQYDADLTTDDGVSIPAHVHSKVFDGGRPDRLKWWSALSVTAKGQSLRVSYRIDDFETEDDGWVALDPVNLTDDYETCEFGLEDICSEAIQFRLANYAGGSTSIKKLILGDPIMVDH